MNLPNPGSTVYISGPMTGIDCFNFKEFFYWHVKLEKSGYKVINPAEIDLRKMFDGWVYEPCMWDEIIREDLRIVREEADWLFVLKGWEDSKGAKMEIAEASDHGKGVYFEDLEVR